MINYKNKTYKNYNEVYNYLIKDYRLSTLSELEKEKKKLELEEIKKKIQKENDEYIIEVWKNFNNKLEDITDIPKLPKGEIYEKYVIPALIRNGAISLKDIKKDHYYYGKSRSGNFAKWNGEKFEVWRYKFNQYYLFNTNHFENDDNFDLFVPIKEITKLQFNNKKL